MNLVAFNSSWNNYSGVFNKYSDLIAEYSKFC